MAPGSCQDSRVVSSRFGRIGAEGELIRKRVEGGDSTAGSHPVFGSLYLQEKNDYLERASLGIQGRDGSPSNQQPRPSSVLLPKRRRSHRPATDPGRRGHLGRPNTG